MAVRRHAARLATVCALLGGLVALGGTPALADDDSVRVRSAGTFTAGGSAEGVAIEVRKRSDGCVLLRTALGLRLAGLRADQVSVQVSAGGRWFPVSLSGGQGSAATAATSPLKPRLCKGKGITVRYRVAFAAAAPNGRLTVSGVASDARGQALGRDAAASRVVGGRATASPTPKPSKKPSPTPSTVATEVRAAGQAPTLAAAGQGAGTANNAAEEQSSGGSVIMFFGIGMVVVGILLIVLLFRRSRADKKPAGDPGHVPLPRNPGGTTYRSGQGPAAAGGQPGQVYGQQPSAPGLYGGGAPTPRPAGGVYGSRPGPTPEATQVVPGESTFPPVSAPPVSPTSAPPVPGQYGPPPAAPPVQGDPGDLPPEADGGGHTVFMPRLPG
ncbi:hypothetical protein [Micromonospora peucetia]|uniref:LPXTG-motif cell wall anchor domain-containing protein n=1 Tax=Micromonospora peucetia TaxID=47871 RepID=A0A1C6UDR2_9ACTN|nr:hypothetical protein [Micromonospora peucetia]WSA33894.1 hypothetical protein OIE14_07565 [Micromonospora peucetia]SCL52176.1 hypothetical protein GA0070608_0974 [Micromonospora peucetia]